MDITTLLEKADAACRTLDYDVCGELATTALSRPEATADQQAVGYTLQAGAFAVQGQTVEAERPYRLLLRIKPDFDLPKDTPPKILAVFRKVQAEENEIRQAVKEAERKKLVESIKLKVEAPTAHKGGIPLDIRADVTDPLKGVQSVVLEYRMGSAGAFATLPFQVTPKGHVATFSAAQTSTDQALKLEYRVVLKDGTGETLATSATWDQPATVAMAAGQVSGPPFWKQPRFWLVAGSGTGVLAGAAVLLSAAVLVTAVVGSGLIYLLLRGDGTPNTQLGKQYV
jgi:hypothetical protein